MTTCRLRYAALVAAIFFLAPVPSAAAPKDALVGTARQTPDSHLTITDVFAYSAFSANPFVGQYTLSPVECVFFQNDAATTMTHARFYFIYSSTDTADAGKVLGFDFMDVRGKFSTGVKQEEYPPRNAPVHGRQCRDIYSLSGNKMIVDKNHGPIALSAVVTDIDYADGTSWHGATPATPSPAP